MKLKSEMPKTNAGYIPQRVAIGRYCFNGAAASDGKEFYLGGIEVSGFRVRFTLHGGIGIATSPPCESLQLAVDRASLLERENMVAIQGVMGPDGYMVLDREGYARLLREKSGGR